MSLTDITASGNGVHHGLVDRLHGGLEMLLDDTVELESLTGSQLEGAVSMLIGDSVHLLPLFGCANTTGQSTSDHEAVSWLKTLRLE